MTIWSNADGLLVKFGRDEASKVVGGEVNTLGNEHITEFYIASTEVQSTSAVIVGSVANPGAVGVTLPKGLIVKEVQIIAEVPFTSSGTIGSSTLSIGFVKGDRTSVYDVDGLTTTSFVGSAIDAAGETSKVIIGATGAGSAIGVALTEDVIVTALNSQHASHPFSTGKALVRVIGYYAN